MHRSVRDFGGKGVQPLHIQVMSYKKKLLDQNGEFIPLKYTMEIPTKIISAKRVGGGGLN